MDIVKRFLNYVNFETTSDEYSDTFPSSEKELPLLMELKKELDEMGVPSFYKDGYVYGKIKSDCNKKDTLFLMAHVDTSPDASGKNIKPSIIHYEGGTIILNETRILDPTNFECLDKHIGHDLIVTDGTTLLGADDKAGCAIIMDTIEKTLKNGNYPNIICCFTPDEEIGRGTEKIDVDFIKEGCDTIYAYTIDGGDKSELSYECFNAAQARVEITGTSIHPSIGKNKLVNAQEVFIKFHELLPKYERPEYTEKREPFIHLCDTNGSVEKFEAAYIIRNFDSVDLERQKNDFINAQNEINKLYNKDICKVTIKNQYRNMREVVEKNPLVVELAHKGLEMAGLDWYDNPIRGGTDGASLSFMGIACPNLGTGGENFHGVYEFLDINDMNTMVDVVTNIMNLLK